MCFAAAVVALGDGEVSEKQQRFSQMMQKLRRLLQDFNTQAGIREVIGGGGGAVGRYSIQRTRKTCDKLSESHDMHGSNSP